jgi:murein DD-endopeptidase MepM/ murein hydrolase activator NlpD
MSQSYFVLDLAHSAQGQVKRIQISYKSLAYAALFAVLLTLAFVGLFSSYLRMSWKVSNYNHLQTDFDHLRTRYSELERVASQHRQQMASLESLAGEVSAAYGINQPTRVVANLDSDAPRNVHESMEEYNFLKLATDSSVYHRYAYRWQSHNEPSLWPVTGAISSSFGGRSDPFSGEGAFHTGVDLQATSGTPVHVTADGVVENAGWSGRYGKLVVIDHGNGLETYYAHLSQFMVIPGQEVRRGDVIAFSGSTGHATGPHMHYEVRLKGMPVNPYRYLARPKTSGKTTTAHDHESDFLGL